ncbi:MAG: hypothetical protein AB7G28_10595 [Pirellulales bacterium]
MNRNFLHEKMFCQLTLLALLFLAGSAATRGQDRAPVGVFSVGWQNLPLANALDRLRAVTEADVFLDRRVDPSQKVQLTAANASIDEVLSSLAASIGLGYARIGRLHYVGPVETATRLPKLVAEQRRDMATLDVELRRSLLGQRRLAWPRLTEPQGLITELIHEHGWKLTGADLIPHDLWAQGELPAMPLSNQLTVLLAGFNLTFRIDSRQQTIDIVPVEWGKVVPRVASPRSSSPAPATRPGKQVFSLRVENQPVGRVLEQLAGRLHWKLTVDEAAIRAAGLSLDRLVSFHVENADEDQLLAALLAPAGLAATRDADRIQIAPRP